MEAIFYGMAMGGVHGNVCPQAIGFVTKMTGLNRYRGRGTVWIRDAGLHRNLHKRIMQDIRTSTMGKHTLMTKTGYYLCWSVDARTRGGIYLTRNRLVFGFVVYTYNLDAVNAVWL
jgi:hypothetical protein